MDIQKFEVVTRKCRERYRDLLQATTSIVAIAQSSKRVKANLEEIKEAILCQEDPPLPQKPTLSGGHGECPGNT